MKFYKPIASTNITVPTLKAFLESKQVQSYSIESVTNVSIPRNTNYSIVFQSLNGKFIVMPMQVIAAGASTDIYNVPGTAGTLSMQVNGDNIKVQGLDGSANIKQLSTIVSAIYTINPTLDTSAPV